jgi:hypothetical protein
MPVCEAVRQGASFVAMATHGRTGFPGLRSRWYSSCEAIFGLPLPA